jgi:hypothetical protein
VYSRYNNDPRTVPWGTPALTVERSVYSVSTSMRKCLLFKQDLRVRKEFRGAESLNLFRNLICHTLLNCVEMSKNAEEQYTCFQEFYLSLI